MKNLVLKLSEKIASILKDHFGHRLVSVCLYGSSARNSIRKGSDIDILIVLEHAPSSYHKRVKEFIPLLDIVRSSQEYKSLEEFYLDLEPSFLIMTAKEVETHPDILIDISQEGILVFDRDGFLKTHLNQIKDRMLQLGSIKKRTPHGHYWCLKPDLKPGEIFEI